MPPPLRCVAGQEAEGGSGSIRPKDIDLARARYAFNPFQPVHGGFRLVLDQQDLEALVVFMIVEILVAELVECCVGPQIQVPFDRGGL